jgi:hypothetical protein
MVGIDRHSGLVLLVLREYIVVAIDGHIRVAVRGEDRHGPEYYENRCMPQGRNQHRSTQLFPLPRRTTYRGNYLAYAERRHTWPVFDALASQSIDRANLRAGFTRSSKTNAVRKDGGLVLLRWGVGDAPRAGPPVAREHQEPDRNLDQAEQSLEQHVPGRPGWG